MKRMRLTRAELAAGMLALCLATPRVVVAQFNPEVLERSVVKVTVTAAGKTHSGTGFLWGNSNQIVTALHLVQPGGNIVVECRGRRQVAQLIRALREADLALLSAPMDGCVPLQSRQDAVPQFGSRLYTFGYGGGAQAGTSKALEKGYTANETLNGILSPTDAAEIRRFGAPSIDLPIYYLQGSLTPGFSGAPVVDNAHRLVGVCATFGSVTPMPRSSIVTISARFRYSSTSLVRPIQTMVVDVSASEPPGACLSRITAGRQ